jgi:hypothetical protein
MPIVPVRDLAKYGFVADVDPYDLPPGAWSFAVNARFDSGRVSRAPVFRSMHVLGTASPRFVRGVTPNSGLDALYLGYLDGTLKSYSAGTETAVHPAGWVASNSELPYSSCHLADVFYVNRGDRVPWALLPSASGFVTLANWNTAWSAKLIRSVGGALVALNVTKTGVTFPTMVKTSSIPQSGTVPTSWDQTVASTLATENILAEMEGPIVDAANLRNDLYIYGLRETWIMSPVASGEVFDYRKVFSDMGAINANCAVEVDGKHYVFGLNDLWVHDGMTKQSLADNTVREFVFSTMNVKQALRCFVTYNERLKELMFCYVSGDRGINFAGGSGCNRAAVYNLVNNTWTLYDLPFIFGASMVNADDTQTWATLTPTWDVLGGSWLDQEDSFKKCLVTVGESSATYSLSASLYAIDLVGTGSVTSFPVDINATKGVFLERDGIDLDEVGADLPGYKIVRSVYPQGRIDSTTSTITFTFGSSDSYNVPAAYGAPQTYDGNSLYKLDFMSAGRFLALQVTFNDPVAMSLSGFDLDLDVLGER